MTSKLATVLLSLALVVAARGATTLAPGTPVDWLDLGPGGTALLDDAGTPAATLQLTITTGILFPTTPAAARLGGPFWTAAPPFIDSILGDSSVSALEVRIAPLNGLADYSIEFALAGSFDVVIGIGQLFGDAVDATDQVHLQASSGAGPSSVEFLGSYAWDDGLRSFDQGLTWDPATNRLNPAPGIDGDSQIAFFRMTGTDHASITLPSGYGVGSGDSVQFAVGIIPEPSIIVLLVSTLLLAPRRRR